MPAPVRDRPLRKDAERNREEVFAAAERVFARAGLTASIDDIAAEAGVGVGTVYRRFGSKAGLVDALFHERLGEVVAMIAECAEAPTGGEALTAVLRMFVDIQTRSLAVQQLLFTDVERAKAEGAVRADFAATDIPVLTRAISTVAAMPDGGRELAQRHLELLIKGMDASPDPTSIPPPLPDARFADWMRGMAGTR